MTTSISISFFPPSLSLPSYASLASIVSISHFKRKYSREMFGEHWTLNSEMNKCKCNHIVPKWIFPLRYWATTAAQCTDEFCVTDYCWQMRTRNKLSASANDAVVALRVCLLWICMSLAAMEKREMEKNLWSHIPLIVFIEFVSARLNGIIINDSLDNGIERPMGKWRDSPEQRNVKVNNNIRWIGRTNGR